MSKISVLMPVHNGSAHLGDALASILTQTFKDFELIVVDDGSEDATGDLIESIAKGDRRVRMLRLPTRQGIVAALNAGLSRCDGEYVARMDADDIAHPQRLAAQAAFLDDHADHVACGSDVWMFGGEYWYARYPRQHGECHSYLALFPCHAHPAVTLRRAALGDTPYQEDYRTAEDYRLWLDLASSGKLANLPRPLLRYRVHSNQSSSTSTQQQRELHGKIAAEALAGFGLGYFTDTDVMRFLWPWESDPEMTRRAYLAHARHLATTLWKLNQGRCGWLRRRMMRVVARNLLQRA